MSAPLAWSHASADESVRDHEMLFDDLIDGLGHDDNHTAEHGWSSEAHGNVWHATSPLGSTSSRDGSHMSNARLRRGQNMPASLGWSHASADESVRDQEMLFDDLIDGLVHDENHIHTAEHGWSSGTNTDFRRDDSSSPVQKWFVGRKKQSRFLNLEF